MKLAFVIEPEMNVPMVIVSSESPNALFDLLATHRDEIIETLNEHGIILFRGFACQDEALFSKAIDICALGRRCSTSDYKIPRTLLDNGVYTSSDLPGHIALELHHEKPRSANPPHHIYFCCITPAEQGGGTLFANAESVWRDIPQSIQNKILEHGVVYRQFLHGSSLQHRWLKKIWGNEGAPGWLEYFGTADVTQIEKKIKEEGLEGHWLHQGRDIILENHLPGARMHPVTQNTSWFNASSYLNYYDNLLFGTQKKLHGLKYLASHYMILKNILPMVCHYGNGDAFSANEITTINRILQNHTRVCNWEKGDFMIVDNFTFMHGKQPHQGTRLLYSCMTEPEDDGSSVCSL